jgi:hypothetical protein
MAALILIAILGYHQFILTSEAPIVALRALDVEIKTSRDVYVLGEDVEVSVYLYNDRWTPVRIGQEGLTFGISVWMHVSFTDDMSGGFVSNSSTVVPARSRILWGKTTFQTKSTGTFTLECVGKRVTVKVVIQDEDATF